MNGLSRETLDSLLIHLHRVIEDVAVGVVDAIDAGTSNESMSYPPNCGLTADEVAALAAVDITGHLKSDLRKVVADAASYPVYDLLCVIDGVADPASDDWPGIALVQREDGDGDFDFLHTEFYESYWNWLDDRPDRGWKLHVG